MADPSTVIDMTVMPPKIIRQGKVMKSIILMKYILCSTELVTSFTEYDIAFVV